MYYLVSHKRCYNVLPERLAKFGLEMLTEKFSIIPADHIPAIDEVRGSVRYVVDGDSLYIDGYDSQIRLWGVDAPEKNEPGFDDATSTLKRIALRKSVSSQRVDTDRYGRTVARCFLEDGREVNAEMISSGRRPRQTGPSNHGWRYAPLTGLNGLQRR